MKDIKQSQPDLTDEEAAQLAASRIADSKPKSRMYYKIGASREMAGGKKVDPRARMSDKLKGTYECFKQGKVENLNCTEVQSTTGKCSIEFQTDAISVLENAGRFGVTIVRRGEAQTEARVQVTTRIRPNI